MKIKYQSTLKRLKNQWNMVLKIEYHFIYEG